MNSSSAAWLAVLVIAWLALGHALDPQQHGRGPLRADFYNASCPSLESIVRSSVVQSVKSFPISLQAVVRLFFHDCFVEGCDASVMISSSPAAAAEKDAIPNQSLAGDGFRAIVDAKLQVERQCPGVVSCADIIAIAARDAVVLANGPTWHVQKGRRDGRVSLASRVGVNLPRPDHNVDEMKAIFKSKGLNATDIVALSGAHTIGFSHCSFFTNRLYQFNATHQVDPTMDGHYASTLQGECPLVGANINTVVALDPITPFAFDNSYYRDLQMGKGLLISDQSLWTDVRTKGLVSTFSSSQTDFFTHFASSMVKLGNVGVKTGNEGEIRRDCTAFNV